MPRRTTNNQVSTALSPRPVDERRLAPPDHLDEPSAALFCEIVESLPCDHFQVSDRPLLAQYCILAGACARCDKDTDAGIKFIAELSKTMASLAVKLRICPSSYKVRSDRPTARTLKTFPRIKVQP